MRRRALAIERAEIERLAKDRDDERAILERSFHARLKELLIGNGPRFENLIPQRRKFRRRPTVEFR